MQEQERKRVVDRAINANLKFILGVLEDENENTKNRRKLLY